MGALRGLMHNYTFRVCAQSIRRSTMLSLGEPGLDLPGSSLLNLAAAMFEGSSPTACAQPDAEDL